jgi:hypothetical protein
MQQIKEKGNKLGLNLQRSDLDTRYINSKDFVSILKGKIFCLLCQVLLPVPSLSPTIQPQKTYKFWVECMGNNHPLVKAVIKKRRWLIWTDVNSEALWAGSGPQAVHFAWTQVRHKRILKDLGNHQIYNHVAGIAEIGQKSNLYVNLRDYYRSQGKKLEKYIPQTYLVKLDQRFAVDETFLQFKKSYKPGELWIYKPGEASNRGNGIRVLKDIH